ncbi:MAG TPA: CocE/NonD family hydrolase, partial [Aquihabitans sp.]|nr:CocE/NonD family hydrolase [Aquihabitans sp.]
DDGGDGGDGATPAAEEPSGPRPGSGGKASGDAATDLDVAVDPDEETATATFEVRAGTEEVTVTGAQPGARLSLVDRRGRRLVVLRADDLGQAHFAYLPARLGEYDTGGGSALPYDEGFIVEPGEGYTVRGEDAEPVERSEPFTVLGRDDHPDPAFFDEQAGELGPTGDETEWYGYVEVRDGVQLSIKVDLPGPASAGPYPTVVEYSGYGPSNPDALEPGSRIAGLLGYATVGVNMRGSGCSGGVFDVFNTAQQVDGYDAVEALARQPWVKGGKVGMVGLSYSGISQLYVAATRPPSLAAITPLSVIKDPWLQQWPGGVYNGGFTKNWLDERDKQSAAGGTSWVTTRVENGDETCAQHLDLREQNIDFEAFGRSLVRRPALADGRDLSRLVSEIDVPVYLTGAWQDEQTGPQFGDLLGRFDQAPVTRFTMFNGRHPDGYTPMVLTRWYEFLELYVDEEVPRLDPGIRAAAPAVFAQEFGVEDLSFEPDRFADFGDDEYDAVRADYEAEDPVRVLYESGAGAEVPGAPVYTFDRTYDAWPPSATEERELHLAEGGKLVEAEDEAIEEQADGADTFANDPASAAVDFFGEEGYQLLAPTWDFDWTRFAAGDAVSYESEPFTEDTVVGGPGYADLHLRVPDGDADVQVSLSLVDAAGTEWHLTSGLLRLSDRAVDEERSFGLLVERSYAEADAEEMPADRFEPARVALPSFAQAFREGDRLVVTISSPGRDFGAWTFETIGEDGARREVGRGPGRPSKLVLGVLPDDGELPALVAPCPSLRGQACRPYAQRSEAATR